MKSSIYKILNLINNKIYVGSAVNYDKRWAAHEFYLNKGKHPNKHIQAAWNKYGAENFEFIALELVEDKTKLLEREQYWIDTLKPEYNICKTAGSNLGIKYSEESKKKMSAWQIGRKMSDEAKAKMSTSAKGHKNSLGMKHSEETRKRMSASRIGKKHSKQHKIKISLSNIGNKSHLGRSFSNEHKANLSKARLGRKLSEETKRKISIANTGSSSEARKLSKRKPDRWPCKEGSKCRCSDCLEIIRKRNKEYYQQRKVDFVMIEGATI